MQNEMSFIFMLPEMSLIHCWNYQIDTDLKIKYFHSMNNWYVLSFVKIFDVFIFVVAISVTDNMRVTLNRCICLLCLGTHLINNKFYQNLPYPALMGVLQKNVTKGVICFGKHKILQKNTFHLDWKITDRSQYQVNEIFKSKIK